MKSDIVPKLVEAMNIRFDYGGLIPLLSGRPQMEVGEIYILIEHEIIDNKIYASR